MGRMFRWIKSILVVGMALLPMSVLAGNSQHGVIKNIVDDEVKCYCDTGKLKSYYITSDEIKQAAKESGSPLAIKATERNILLVDLPPTLQSRYAGKCGDSGAETICWLKASAVETSQDTQVGDAVLANRQRPCAEKGTYMGSEACSDN